MVFAGGLADQHFASISEETVGGAKQRDVFARLESVAALVQQLVPDDADAAAFDRSLDLIFHCYHFWKAGCPLYALEDGAVRDLIDNPPELSAWTPTPPHASLYLELPQNLLWAAVTEGDIPEPVEGLFLRIEEGQAVSILLVLGMRLDRPGFSVSGIEAQVSDATDTDEPGAFRSDIPGADLAGLYSLQRPLEALLLALRVLWYVESYPEAAESVRVDIEATSESNGGLTNLDHHIVRLVERSRE
jgi:hypothetical protein